MKPKYYEAYEERYKEIHKRGVSWSSNIATPIVLDVIKRFSIRKEDSILEIGCGEGRDAKAVLDAGYNLLTTDISNEAIKYCKDIMPNYESHFMCLDCLKDELDKKYKFVYAVAVIHMLVLDEDRNRFYETIHNHLDNNGVALICSMGDGETEMKSDINQAFDIQNRVHETGDIMVAATSCRMVSFPTFENEIKLAGLEIIEKGITESLPDFNNLMYAIVKRK